MGAIDTSAEAVERLLSEAQSLKPLREAEKVREALTATVRALVAERDAARAETAAMVERTVATIEAQVARAAREEVADLQRQLAERDAAMQAQARQWAADRMTEANYERG